MIKDLKKFQIKLTPFQATRDWELENVFNDDVLLLEQTGSDGSDIALALEFIDYGDGSGNPTSSSTCDIALEQQEEDRAVYREGQNIQGIFYPSEPQNLDGTYKRLVHAQYKNVFYNDFRNPTEIWGTENIDFELSKTKRFLSDGIQVFEIPQNVFGDKIVPNTVHMFNYFSDNEYEVSDDGDGNLLAGTNLFSKTQEIGMFGNTFVVGSDSTCNSYFGSPTASLDPIATDWALRVVANGGALPSVNSQKAYSDFVTGCKADGIWNELIIFNGIAPDSKKAMNTPLLVGPGLGLWTSDTSGDVLDVNGYRTNGVGSTTTVATASAIWSSGTDAGFFVYASRDRDGGTNPGDIFNGFAGTPSAGFEFGFDYQAMWVPYLLYTFSFFGYYSMNRNANNNQVLYFANSTSSHSTILTDSVVRPTVVPSEPLTVMQSPGGGGGTGVLQGTVSAIGFSKYLTSASSSLLYNRIQALRVAFGGGFV